MTEVTKLSTQTFRVVC